MTFQILLKAPNEALTVWQAGNLHKGCRIDILVILRSCWHLQQARYGRSAVIGPMLVNCSHC